MELKKRIKEKHYLWFKLKSVSRINAGYRTELHEQYREVSKDLNRNTERGYWVLSNFVKNSKTDPKMLYSSIVNK